MKKFIPLLLFIMAFSGFLSTQILWDTFHLNAEHVEQSKQKESVYEKEFQDLKLTTTKNTVIDLKAEKTPIIILNFWASWCLPCLQEFPSLVEFQKKYKDQVKVIGINGDIDNPEGSIEKVEKDKSLNFESVIDKDSSISNKFKITTYPVSIVFHQGKVIFESKKVHNFMDSKFIELIDDTLKAK